MLKEFIELIYWKIILFCLNMKLSYLIIKNIYLRRRLDKLYRTWK